MKRAGGPDPVADAVLVAFRIAVHEAAKRIAADPAALERVIAVNAESPVRERLAATLLGYYMPMTGNEVRELDEALTAAMSGHFVDLLAPPDDPA